MTLEISQDERDVICELISRELDEIGPEIHHTRTRNYRDELKRRKRTLERLAEHLGAPMPSSEQPGLDSPEGSQETPAPV